MDLSNYKEKKEHFFWIYLWKIVNITIFRFLFFKHLNFIRLFLLRLFGANIPYHALVYPSCKIWAPWNLTIGKYSCIGPNVELYNKAPIVIGNNAVVSQGAKLYTASHDIYEKKFSLITAPIHIEDKAWVASFAYIGMGVTIGKGAVVGATASVYKDVEPWTVVGGNPAKFIKKRIIKEQ